MFAARGPFFRLNPWFNVRLNNASDNRAQGIGGAWQALPVQVIEPTFVATKLADETFADEVRCLLLANPLP